MSRKKEKVEVQDTKIAELEKKYGKVEVLRLKADPDDKNPCVVYFKPSNTFTKMQCLDMLFQTKMKAGATFFEATVIKEESDKRVFVQDNDDDTYYIGAVLYCVGKLQRQGGIIKKK